MGAGYWGPNIIRNFYENPACCLTAVCDQDTDALNRLKEMYGPQFRYETDYSALLEDSQIQAIAVVTNIPSHLPLAKAALEAGKHVFVEKPLAMTAEDCRTLGQLAEKNSKTLMVGHTFVYNPAVRTLKDIVNSGELGDIYYFHSKRVNLGRVQTKFNALWSLAVHDISIVLYLFDELPTEVRAWGNAFITPGVEDVVFLNLTFPSGKLAHMHVSWLDPEKKRQVTLVGSRKMVVYDDVSLDQKIAIYDKGVDKILTDSTYPEYKDFSEFQLLVRSGNVTLPHLNFVEPLKVECQHFIDCATGKIDKPLSGWPEGEAVVRVLEAGQISLEQAGHPVEIVWPTLAKKR